MYNLKDNGYNIYIELNGKNMKLIPTSDVFVAKRFTFKELNDSKIHTLDTNETAYSSIVEVTAVGNELKDKLEVGDRVAVRLHTGAPFAFKDPKDPQFAFRFPDIIGKVVE